MSIMQLESVWKIMEKYDFSFKSHNYLDLICNLCKKFLIKAMQAPCGCRFCSNCIEEYLCEDNKICPGNTEECQEEYLKISENVFNDYVTNRRMMKLKLKCPKIDCLFEDILINMDKHLMVCGKLNITCPYTSLGCDVENYDKEKIVEHLKLQNYHHSKLIIKTIENLKNEIEILTQENQLLKEDLNKKQICIDELNNKMNLLMDWNNNRQISYSASITNVNLHKDINGDIIDDETNNEIQSIIWNCRIFGELIWKIDNFSELKSKIQLDSAHFVTHQNGYRFQLRMLANISWKLEDYKISFYPNCIPGSHDKRLVWPFTCQVSIGIIDQINNQYSSLNNRIITYFQPINSTVRPFNFLLQKKSMLTNNCLIVKCFVKLLE